MVRYSKLPFRETVRELTARFNPAQQVVVYTPMILAREFARNGVARLSDFTSSSSDSPLLVQFGSANPEDLARAALLVAPYCDGIGLNCGCPIPEQCREGVGAALMVQPHVVAAMVRAVKREVDLFVEVKIRIHTDLAVTRRFARIVEASGADAICVHGRRKADRSGNVPVSLEGIKAVRSSVSLPVIANGDFRSFKQIEKFIDATRAAESLEKPSQSPEIPVTAGLETSINGLMSARGVLSNPAMFCPQFETCPWAAVEILWDHIMVSGLPFQLILHHFVEMFKGRGDLAVLRKDLVSNLTTIDLIDWFDRCFDLKRRGEPGFGERTEWPILV